MEQNAEEEKVGEIEAKYTNPAEPGSLGSLKNFLRNSQFSDRKLVVNTIKRLDTYSTHRQGKHKNNIRRKTYPLWRGDILGNFAILKLSENKMKFQ